MDQLKIRDDFIKLGQAMKLSGLVDEGIDAKEAILAGKVTVNGIVDTRRGKKLYVGDRFSFEGTEIEIIH